MQHKEIIEQLTNSGIKPSFHRIKVMEYLMMNHNHPTVDDIYTSLKKELPTLSKATIYNTVSLFGEAKLTRAIIIENKEVRYDLIEDKNHGHFKCDACEEIFDFATNIDDLAAQGLSEFVINEKNVYFTGLCPRCLLNNREK
jgi:Fur family peroxide stress response transcriptional regulator